MGIRDLFGQKIIGHFGVSVIKFQFVFFYTFVSVIQSRNEKSM